MSLITRCTACQTLFKVVPDQLRISDGWVRCGQCGEIFDAAQNLLVEQDEPPTAAEEAIGEHGASRTAQAPAQPDSTVAAEEPESLVDISLPVTADAGAGADATATPDATPPSPAEAVPATDKPSFMQEAATPSPWQRRGVRRALAVAAAVLVVALVTQVLRHERDRLAAVEPALRPVLGMLCQWTGCSISPMRQIESVVIDSSSFSRLRGDGYRLAFSLRNAAPVDIAMPSLELSVTDAQDQALARRVILPAEFGATTPVLGAGAEWGGRISLNVKSGGTERVAGYRLVAFYP